MPQAEVYATFHNREPDPPDYRKHHIGYRYHHIEPAEDEGKCEFHPAAPAYRVVRLFSRERAALVQKKGHHDIYATTAVRLCSECLDDPERISKGIVFVPQNGRIQQLLRGDLDL